MKRTRKITAQAGFIRRHPWRSPFGPAEAVLIYSNKFSRKDDSNLKPAFTASRDESAVLAFMAYVDLNPIRAKIANTPETSKHTSIQKRLESIKQPAATHSLMPFVGNPRQDIPRGIAFSLKDYCE